MFSDATALTPSKLKSAIVRAPLIVKPNRRFPMRTQIKLIDNYLRRSAFIYG